MCQRRPAHRLRARCRRRQHRQERPGGSATPQAPTAAAAATAADGSPGRIYVLPRPLPFSALLLLPLLPLLFLLFSFFRHISVVAGRRGGMRVGDVITSIDGRLVGRTAGVDAAVRYVSGPAGPRP